MNLRKYVRTYTIADEPDPWQALASSMIIQAVKDFRSYGRMLYRLRSKARHDKKLSEEELLCLYQRIDLYQAELGEVRSFFRSAEFLLYSDLDGIAILRRLEREIA